MKNILESVKKNDNLPKVQNNYQAIIKDFNWDKINGQYLQLFEECMAKGKRK